ncbi:glucosaminidase domain-containing protein [Paenibacillus sp. NPDC058174]|uniref:glucosaminidase domain-containing protein n=1 Tax=Paenibacillus sp. NPDC058174 TaxID=3346366 RepID=UPI0036DE4539
MRKKRNLQWFVYVLCAALLTTLGMQFPDPYSKSAAVEQSQGVSLTASLDQEWLSPPTLESPADSFSFSAPEPEKRPSVHIASSSDESVSSASTEPQAAGDLPIDGTSEANTNALNQSPANSESSSSIPADEAAGNKPAIDPPPADSVYEVTAHYLNIRSESNANSEIVQVVKQGTKLAVDQPLENGWVALKDGGFVHGRYVKELQQTASAAETPEHLQQVIEQAFLRNEDTLRITIPQPLPEEEESEPLKPSSIVGADSGLTESHIAEILDNTALAGQNLEQAILKIEEEYGINAYFTIAVMKLESGNGKSKLAKNKNNLFGLNATGSNPHNRAFTFETKGDSVLKFGQLLSKNYVNKGYTTVEKIARKYCPANPEWPNLVLKIMKSDFKKL